MSESKIAVVPVHKPAVPAQDSENCFLTMLCQVQIPKNILITTLAAFQRHGADARPSIVVTFYDEIVQSKNVVLGRADILDGALSKSEAITLLNDFVLCYTTETLYQHISLLNTSSARFDFDSFMETLSQIQAH